MDKSYFLWWYAPIVCLQRYRVWQLDNLYTVSSSLLLSD